MLSPSKTIARKPQQFLTLTGMELSEFARLLPALERAAGQHEQKRKARVIRTGEVQQQPPSSGAQYANSQSDRCMMLLLYNRRYGSQEFLTLCSKLKCQHNLVRLGA